MKKILSLIKLPASAACLYLLFAGCQKVEHGYISDRIFYQVNPFYISQGVTAVSSSLVGDGSTAPLHVQVLALRDSLGHNADSLLTTPRSIVTYTSTLTYADSTIALMKAKLKDSLVRPFNIAEIGGRLQFTAATTFVPTGRYNLDIAVSNTRGTRVIQNACELIIQPLSRTYNLAYRRFGVYDTTGNTLVSNFDNQDEYCAMEIKHVSGTPVSQIIYKWVDKNGVAFRPNKGEVTAWSAALPTLHNWSPFYPEVYGDSTISQQIPDVGLSMPYFNPIRLANGNTFSDVSCRVDYKLSRASTTSNTILKSMTSLQYLTSGTYYVTVHLNSVVHR